MKTQNGKAGASHLKKCSKFKKLWSHGSAGLAQWLTKSLLIKR